MKREEKWIVISEKVPEQDGYYLTSTVYNEVYCDYWSVDHFNRTETVLAWMPLPEPYKEEMEDDVKISRRLCRENYKAQMESLGYDASGNLRD